MSELSYFLKNVANKSTPVFFIFVFVSDGPLMSNHDQKRTDNVIIY